MKDLKDFTREDRWMAEKHMNMKSAQHLIREMQIKII